MVKGKDDQGPGESNPSSQVPSEFEMSRKLIDLAYKIANDEERVLTPCEAMTEADKLAGRLLGPGPHSFESFEHAGQAYLAKATSRDNLLKSQRERLHYAVDVFFDMYHGGKHRRGRPAHAPGYLTSSEGGAARA